MGTVNSTMLIQAAPADLSDAVVDVDKRLGELHIRVSFPNKVPQERVVGIIKIVNLGLDSSSEEAANHIASNLGVNPSDVWYVIEVEVKQNYRTAGYGQALYLLAVQQLEYNPKAWLINDVFAGTTEEARRVWSKLKDYVKHYKVFMSDELVEHPTYAAQGVKQPITYLTTKANTVLAKKYAYHNTLVRRLPSIQKLGLLPGFKSSFDNTVLWDKVWFSATKNDYPVLKDSRPKQALLRFPWPSDAKDEGKPSKFDPQEWSTKQKISPQSIEILTDAGWKPLVENNTKATAGKNKAVKNQITFAGLPVCIEYEVGDIKTHKDGTRSPYWYSYGFIKNTKADDGGSVDVYLGPNQHADNVYVVKQIKKDGTYDEDKVMLGFNSESHARTAYLAQYPLSFYGGISHIPMQSFKSRYIDDFAVKSSLEVYALLGLVRQGKLSANVLSRILPIIGPLQAIAPEVVSASALDAAVSKTNNLIVKVHAQLDADDSTPPAFDVLAEDIGVKNIPKLKPIPKLNKSPKLKEPPKMKKLHEPKKIEVPEKKTNKAELDDNALAEQVAAFIIKAAGENKDEDPDQYREEHGKCPEGYHFNSGTGKCEKVDDVNLDKHHELNPESKPSDKVIDTKPKDKPAKPKPDSETVKKLKQQGKMTWEKMKEADKHIEEKLDKVLPAAVKNVIGDAKTRLAKKQAMREVEGRIAKTTGKYVVESIKEDVADYKQAFKTAKKMVNNEPVTFKEKVQLGIQSASAAADIAGIVAGVMSFGVGTVAEQGAKIAIKQGVKAAAKRFITKEGAGIAARAAAKYAAKKVGKRIAKGAAKALFKEYQDQTADQKKGTARKLVERFIGYKINTMGRGPLYDRAIHQIKKQLRSEASVYAAEEAQDITKDLSEDDIMKLIYMDVLHKETMSALDEFMDLSSDDMKALVAEQMQSRDDELVSKEDIEDELASDSDPSADAAANTDPVLAILVRADTELTRRGDLVLADEVKKGLLRRITTLDNFKKAVRLIMDCIARAKQYGTPGQKLLEVIRVIIETGSTEMAYKVADKDQELADTIIDAGQVLSVILRKVGMKYADDVFNLLVRQISKLMGI